MTTYDCPKHGLVELYVDKNRTGWCKACRDQKIKEWLDKHPQVRESFALPDWARWCDLEDL